jgi:energy-coupling factor transporter ATP-binding protein EcfA2
VETTEQPWEAFLKSWRHQFMQGEHVTIIGPTGSGKTLLAKRLIQVRSHVVGLGIKPRDSSMEDLMQAGWHRVDKWSARPKSATRVLLWPKTGTLDETRKIHRERFTELLEAVWKQGGWCIWTDELRYLTHNCRMLELYQQMYVTSRSNKISLVSAAQRPKWIPLEAMSQASHLILYRTGDESDLVRMGGLNGNNAKQVANTVADLPDHTFLYVNMRNGNQAISKVAL